MAQEDEVVQQIAEKVVPILDEAMGGIDDTDIRGIEFIGDITNQVADVVKPYLRRPLSEMTEEERDALSDEISAKRVDELEEEQLNLLKPVLDKLNGQLSEGLLEELKFAISEANGVASAACFDCGLAGYEFRKA